MKKNFDAIASYVKRLFRVASEVNKIGMTREEAEEKIGKMYDALPRNARRRAMRKMKKRGLI